MIRENTIASLKDAYSHGADMVEFDIQLSKDLIPVIYHDFELCTTSVKKHDEDQKELVQMQLKNLTLEQLRGLKVSLKVLEVYNLSGTILDPPPFGNPQRCQGVQGGDGRRSRLPNAGGGPRADRQQLRLQHRAQVGHAPRGREQRVQGSVRDQPVLGHRDQDSHQTRWTEAENRLLLLQPRRLHNVSLFLTISNQK